MIIESKGRRYGSCTLFFPYKGDTINFNSNNTKDLFKNVIDWLYNNGYKFQGPLHTGTSNKILTEKEVDDIVSKTTYEKRMFYNIVGSGNFIAFNSKVKQLFGFLTNMLVNFGIDKNSIKYEGLDLQQFKIKKFGEIDIDDEELEDDFSDLDQIKPNELDKLKKMNFLVACQFVLKQNDNRPMNSHEIWEEIKKQNLVNTNGLTPWDTINAQMILSSINTTAKGKKKNSIFQIIEGTKPYKFILLNPDNIQNVTDEDEDLEEILDGDYDVDDVENFSKRFRSPTDFKASQTQSEDDVKPFNKFKASQSEEEKESFYGFTQNPFIQAICVLGGSGAGKSTTIENILDEEGHEFEFIIPSSSTTRLLSQFSPSKSCYVPSKLGQMILNAYENPTQLFTAVFDECHKSNVIEMINDELLQAISTKRNAGRRFISLDDDTAELYPGVEKHRGNILIPDNLGFIFISSKPDVIIHNDDFFNRLEIVQLKSYEEERLANIEQLLSKTLSNEEKESLKSNND